MYMESRNRRDEATATREEEREEERERERETNRLEQMIAETQPQGKKKVKWQVYITKGVQ